MSEQDRRHKKEVEDKAEEMRKFIKVCLPHQEVLIQLSIYKYVLKLECERERESCNLGLFRLLYIDH